MTVEAIQNKEKIGELYRSLGDYHPKYALIFKFGINTGLKISDIILLKVSDICNKNFQICDSFLLREKATGKEKRILLNDTLKNVLKEYLSLQKLGIDEYLFPSQKGSAIGRIQVYRVLKEAATKVGIENFGTHSLRKTWGYWMYRLSANNLPVIMERFNHTSPSATLRYIGIDPKKENLPSDMVQL